MSSTELRKERISSWSDSVHFVHSKDVFVWTTRSRQTQHYSWAHTCYNSKCAAHTSLSPSNWQTCGCFNSSLGTQPQTCLSPKQEMSAAHGTVLWSDWGKPDSRATLNSASAGKKESTGTCSEWHCGISRFKGIFSLLSLIHGLNHRETVLDSLSRDQVSRTLIYRVLSTSETTARQQYIAVNGSKYKPPPKSRK